MTNKELNLPPETERERHKREMRAISDEQNKGLKARLAKQEADFQRDVKEVMKAGYTRKEAEKIVNEKYMPSTESKKKKPESMMDGGKVRKKKKYGSLKSLIRFKEEIQAIREALPGVTRKEAMDIIYKRDMEYPKKKKTAKKMMSGGKVYSRGSRKAKYNG